MAKIYWPMTSETHKRYLALSNTMIEAAQEGDQLRLQEAQDQFRSLPGLPQGIHPELDLVVPLIKDTSSKIITLGSTH